MSGARRTASGARVLAQRHVQACLLALEEDEALGNTYLITGGAPVNLWEVIARIAARRGLSAPARKVPVKKALRIGGFLEAIWRLLCLPGEPPLTRYKASILGYTQTYDISAARRDLGYAPEMGWEDGVDEFLASLEETERGRGVSPEFRAGFGAEAPPSEITMTLMAAGHTLARERFLGYGGWGEVRLPASFALLEHPTEGPGLFDTGYSHRFHEATGPWPYRLYRWLTPVEAAPEEDAVAQLSSRGLEPAAIRWILLSHFDPDHVGGLRDFPGARVYCSWRAWEDVRGRAGWGALRRRVLPALLPDDLAARTHILPDPVGAPVGPLGPALDLFGDGAIRVLSLPGHAAGHLGALIRDRDRGEVLLCGDACWTSRSLEGGDRRTGLHAVIAADRGAQRGTYDHLTALRREKPEIRVVPTHCRDAFRRFDDQAG